MREFCSTASSPVIGLAGQLVTLFVADIPGQQGRAAGMGGVRASASPLALAWRGRGGWGVQDQVLAELFLGLRLSSAHHYLPTGPGDTDPTESALGFGGVLAYSAARDSCYRAR